MCHVGLAETITAHTSPPSSAASSPASAALDAFEIDEGGGNLSVGEVALLCLARASLRRPRMILMQVHKTAAISRYR